MNKITLILDSHDLSTFQRCEKNYEFVKIESIQSKNVKRGIAKGTLWHHLMHLEYLADKKEWQHSKWLTFVSKYVNRFKDLSMEDRLLVFRRYLEYKKHYENRKIRVLGSEVGFSKVLYEDAQVLIVYEGKIDRIELHNKDEKVWRDFKTQHPKFVKDLYPNVNQFLGYTWALEASIGIIDYTTFSLKPNDNTFREQAVPFSSAQIKAWREDTIEWCHSILKATIDNKFRRNRAACDGKYGICPYHKLCENANLPVVEYLKRRDFHEVEPFRPW